MLSSRLFCDEFGNLVDEQLHLLHPGKDSDLLTYLAHTLPLSNSGHTIPVTSTVDSNATSPARVLPRSSFRGHSSSDMMRTLNPSPSLSNPNNSIDVSPSLLTASSLDQTSSIGHILPRVSDRPVRISVTSNFNRDASKPKPESKPLYPLQTASSKFHHASSQLTISEYLFSQKLPQTVPVKIDSFKTQSDSIKFDSHARESLKFVPFRGQAFF